LINNRQGGRRRGRGGQRQNLGGQPGNNRQDNRQRGNAAQLLEKYKSLARDSQLAGDRVQTEYFLQYADHYYRVLGENRPRFDEQRRSRDGADEDSDGGSSYNDGGYQHGDEQFADAEGEGPSEERQERHDRGPQRPERSERYNRDQRPRREDREERVASEAPAEPEHLNGGETIPFDVLPPAIGRDSGDGDEAPAEERPKPRRRTRAARPVDDEGEIAPAA
jgi:hypothetical protein